MNTEIYLDSNSERRNSHRWYPPFDFMIRRIDEPPNNATGATALNISAHGAALLCYREFDIGDEIYLDAGTKKTVIGKVISREPAWDYWDNGGLIRLGVKLIDSDLSHID